MLLVHRAYKEKKPPEATKKRKASAKGRLSQRHRGRQKSERPKERHRQRLLQPTSGFRMARSRLLQAGTVLPRPRRFTAGKRRRRPTKSLLA